MAEMGLLEVDGHITFSKTVAGVSREGEGRGGEGRGGEGGEGVVNFVYLRSLEAAKIVLRSWRGGKGGETI